MAINPRAARRGSRPMRSGAMSERLIGLGSIVAKVLLPSPARDCGFEPPYSSCVKIRRVQQTFQTRPESPPPLKRTQHKSCGTTGRMRTTPEKKRRSKRHKVRVTMLRLAWAGLALACSAAQALAGSPPPVEDPGNAPMRFEWRREGPADVCGSSCRVWISAIGYLTSDTAREFEAFAEKNDIRGTVLVLDSDGGSVLGTIALGRAIRRLEMVTTVGKTVPLPPTAQGERRAKLAPNASCESMCAFLLLAGSRRYVPPQAQVLVHQIWLGKKRKNALDSNYSAEELNLVQRDIGRLAQYTIEMGGGIELLETALRIPPWEPLYALSKEEIERMRLNTIATLFDRDLTAPAPAPATTSLATVGQPSAERD